MPDNVCILLCKPNINVSTREVYTALRVDQLDFHPDVDAQTEALRAGDIRGITAKGVMYNVLETVTGEKYPVIKSIENDMLEAGALAAIMSGSGPTVFGIFDNADRAEVCRNSLRRTRPSARTFLTWPAGGEKV